MPLSCHQGRIAAGMKKLAFGINCNDPVGYMNMPSKHAEADAMNKIRFKKNMPRHIDIFVIRLNKLGNLGESRPCYHCLTMMELSGLNIKYIYYSTASGHITREKFSTMKDSPITHVSSGIRKINRMKTTN
jgi:hypothetical protein